MSICRLLGVSVRYFVRYASLMIAVFDFTFLLFFLDFLIMTLTLLTSLMHCAAKASISSTVSVTRGQTKWPFLRPWLPWPWPRRRWAPPRRPPAPPRPLPRPPAPPRTWGLAAAAPLRGGNQIKGSFRGRMRSYIYDNIHGEITSWSHNQKQTLYHLLPGV